MASGLRHEVPGNQWSLSEKGKLCLFSRDPPPKKILNAGPWTEERKPSNSQVHKVSVLLTIEKDL